MAMNGTNKNVYQPQMTYASSASLMPTVRLSGSQSARGSAPVNIASTITDTPHSARGASTKSRAKLPIVASAWRNRQATSAFAFDGFGSPAARQEYTRTRQQPQVEEYAHAPLPPRRRVPQALPAVEVAVHRKDPAEEEEKLQQPQWPRASNASRRALVEYLSSPTRCHLFHEHCEIRTVGSTLDRMIALGGALDETLSPTHPPLTEQASLASLLVACQKLDELGHRFSDLHSLVDGLDGVGEMITALRHLFPNDPLRRHMFRLVFEYLSGSDCELFSEAHVPVNGSTGEIEVLLDAGGLGPADPNLDPDSDTSSTLDILIELDHQRCKFIHFGELVQAVAQEKKRRNDTKMQARKERETLLATQRELILNYFVRKASAMGDTPTVSTGGVVGVPPSLDSSGVYFTHSRKLVCTKGDLDTLVRVGGGEDDLQQLTYLLDLLEEDCKKNQVREKLDGVGANTIQQTPSPSYASHAPPHTSSKRESHHPHAPLPLLFINDVPTLTHALQSTYERSEWYKSTILKWLNSKSCTLFTPPRSNVETTIVSEAFGDGSIESSTSASSSTMTPMTLKRRLEHEAKRIEQEQRNEKRRCRGLEPLPIDIDDANTNGDGVVGDVDDLDFRFTPSLVSHIFLCGRSGFTTLSHAQMFETEGRHFETIEEFVKELRRRHKETEKERDVFLGRSALRQYIFSQQCKLFSLVTSSSSSSSSTHPHTSSSFGHSNFAQTSTRNFSSSGSGGGGIVELCLNDSDLDALVKVSGGVNLAILFLRHFDLYQHRYYSWSSLLSSITIHFSYERREKDAWQLLNYLSNPTCNIFRMKEKTTNSNNMNKVPSHHQPSSTQVAASSSPVTSPTIQQSHAQAHAQVLDLETGKTREEITNNDTRAATSATITASANPIDKDAPLGTASGKRTGVVRSHNLPPKTGDGKSGRSMGAPSTVPPVYTVSGLTLRDMHRLYEASSAGPETLWHLQQLSLYEPNRPAMKDLDELIAVVRRNHACLLRKLELDLPFLKTYLFGTSRWSTLFEEPMTELYDDWLVRVTMACGGSVAGVIYVLSRIACEDGTLTFYRDTPNTNHPTSQVPNLNELKEDSTKSKSITSSSASSSAIAASTSNLGKSVSSVRPVSRGAPLVGRENGRGGGVVGQSSSSSNPSAHIPPSLKFPDPSAASNGTNQNANGHVGGGHHQRDALLQWLELLHHSRVGTSNSPPMWLLVELQNMLNLKNSGFWRKRVVGAPTNNAHAHAHAHAHTKGDGLTKSTPTNTNTGSVGTKKVTITDGDTPPYEDSNKRAGDLELALTHALDEEHQPDVPYMDLTTVGEIWNELGGMGMQIVTHLIYFSACVRHAAATSKDDHASGSSSSSSSKKSSLGVGSNPATWHQSPSKPCESLPELIDTLRRVHLHLFASAGTNASASQTITTGSIHSHIEIVLTYLYSPVSQLLPRPTIKDVHQYTTFLHPINLQHLHFNHNTTFWTSNPSVFQLTSGQVSQLIRVVNSNSRTILGASASASQEEEDQSIGIESYEDGSTDAETPSHALAVLIDLDLAIRKQMLHEEAIDHNQTRSLDHTNITAVPGVFTPSNDTRLNVPFDSFSSLLIAASRRAAVRLDGKLALLAKLTATDPNTGLSTFFHENLPTPNDMAEQTSEAPTPATLLTPDSSILSVRSHLALTLGDLSRLFSTSSGGGLEGLPPDYELLLGIFHKLIGSGATFANFHALVASMRVAAMYTVHTLKQEKMILLHALHGPGVGLVAPGPITPPNEYQLNVAIKSQAQGFLKRMAMNNGGVIPTNLPNGGIFSLDDPMGDVDCIATYPYVYRPTRSRFTDLELEMLLALGGSNQASVVVYWLMRIVEWKNQWQQHPNIGQQQQHRKRTQHESTTRSSSPTSGEIPSSSPVPASTSEALPPGYHAPNPFIFRSIVGLAQFVNDLRFRDGTTRRQELKSYLEDPNCPLFGAMPSVFITNDAIDKLYYEALPGLPKRSIETSQPHASSMSVDPMPYDGSVPAPGDVLFHLWCFESLGLTADSLYDLIDHLTTHVAGLGERRKSERMTIVALLGQPACALLRHQKRVVIALTQAQIQANQDAARKKSAMTGIVASSSTSIDAMGMTHSHPMPVLNTHVFVGRNAAPHSVLVGGATPVGQRANSGVASTGTTAPTSPNGAAAQPATMQRPFFSGFHCNISQLDSLLSSSGRSITYALLGLLDLSSDSIGYEFRTIQQLIETLQRWYQKRKESEAIMLEYLTQPIASAMQGSSATATSAALQPRPPSRANTTAVGGRAGARTETNPTHMAGSAGGSGGTDSLGVGSNRSKCILFAHAPVPVIWSPSLIGQLFLRAGCNSHEGLLAILQSLNETIHAAWQHYGTSLVNAEQLIALVRSEEEFLRWRRREWTKELLTGGSSANSARDLAHLLSEQFLVTSPPSPVNLLAPHHVFDRFRQEDGRTITIRVPVPLAALHKYKRAAEQDAADAKAAKEAAAAAGPNTKGAAAALAQRKVTHTAAAATNRATPKTNHIVAPLKQSTSDDTYEDDFDDSVPPPSSDPGVRVHAGPESLFLPGSVRLGARDDIDWDASDDEESTRQSAIERMRALEKEIAEEEEEDRKANQQAVEEATIIPVPEQTPNDSSHASASSNLPASAPLSVSTDPLDWYYLDDGQNLQGPFSTRLMSEWLAQGALPTTLLVKTVAEYAQPDTKWKTIAQRGEFSGREEPIASPKSKNKLPMTVGSQPTHIHSSSRSAVVPASLPASIAPLPLPPAIAPRSTPVVVPSRASPPPATSPTVSAAAPVLDIYEIVHDIDLMDARELDSKFVNSNLINFKKSPSITHVVANAQSQKDGGPVSPRFNNNNNNDTSSMSSTTNASPTVPVPLTRSMSVATPRSLHSTPPSTAPAQSKPPLTSAASLATRTPAPITAGAPSPLSVVPPSSSSVAPPKSVRSLPTRLQLEDDPDVFTRSADEARIAAEDRAKEEERQREEMLYAIDDFAIDPIDSSPRKPVLAPKISQEKLFFATEPIAAMTTPLESPTPLKDELDDEFDIDHDLPSLDIVDEEELNWTTNTKTNTN